MGLRQQSQMAIRKIAVLRSLLLARILLTMMIVTNAHNNDDSIDTKCDTDVFS